MSAIRGNTSFQGTIQDSSDLEVLDNPEFVLNWYTDYPSRIPVKDNGTGATDYLVKFDMSNWENNLMIMSGLPYVLDLYMPNVPVGTTVTLSTAEVEFEGAANPLIINVDSNTIQPNGICRFAVTFANPPARHCKEQGFYAPIRWNYYVSLLIETSFGSKIHRVLVHNSGLGDEPTVGYYNKDQLLFLPINRYITILMASAGGGGAGSIDPSTFQGIAGLPPEKQYRFSTANHEDGSAGATAEVLLYGKHRWLNWNIPVNGADVSAEGAIRDENGKLMFPVTHVAFCGGGGGGVKQPAGGASQALGGAPGINRKLSALNNPNNGLIAVGAGALNPMGVTLHMGVQASSNGNAGASETTNSTGGLGGASDPDGSGYIRGMGGQGGRPWSDQFDFYLGTSGYGGGGGSGTMNRFYLRYVANIPNNAGRQYLPPLVLKLSMDKEIVAGKGGAGVQYGWSGTNGLMYIAEYVQVPYTTN